MSLSSATKAFVAAAEGYANEHHVDGSRAKDWILLDDGWAMCFDFYRADDGSWALSSVQRVRDPVGLP